jgi:hypothetical protein
VDESHLIHRHPAQGEPLADLGVNVGGERQFRLGFFPDQNRSSTSMSFVSLLIAYLQKESRLLSPLSLV